MVYLRFIIEFEIYDLINLHLATQAKHTTEESKNINTNTNNININIEHPKRKSTRTTKPRNKPNPSWYTKIIVGGIITLILSLCGYYIKGNKGVGNNDNPASLPSGELIEGTKQN